MPHSQYSDPTAEARGPEHLIEQMTACYRCDEAALMQQLIPLAQLTPIQQRAVQARAQPLVAAMRSGQAGSGSQHLVENFMHTYALSSQEGVVLMCLAEALLRIPDDATIDKLIRDKIGSADWAKHVGESSSLLVNASTWALLLTGQVVTLDTQTQDWRGSLSRMVQRVGEPMIRAAMLAAIRMMGEQFVLGRNIQAAIQRAKQEQPAYRHSYDMLGEAARTEADAERYYNAYRAAIQAIGSSHAATHQASDHPLAAPSISIKLSALHPRYEENQRQRVFAELAPRLLKLAEAARAVQIGLTVDAEESERLMLSLDLFAHLCQAPSLAGWQGLGLAVQAYQKRALPVLHWLAWLGQSTQRKIMVRLVKGAYWDTEIKRTQEQGLSDYPVFTRKVNTDVSYLACARYLLSEPVFYPAFATHNAHTVAALAAMAEEVAQASPNRAWEYQRLHGMGNELYDTLLQQPGFACRAYAPVGEHADLLAYLVRRLLENGANTSFVHRLSDPHFADSLLADPAEQANEYLNQQASRQPRIPLPAQLYPTHRNSAGVDFSNPASIAPLQAALTHSQQALWHAAPVINGQIISGPQIPVSNPAKLNETIGLVHWATLTHVEQAMYAAQAGFAAWSNRPATQRAAILEACAEILQNHLPELVALIVREGGRTQPDAVAEVREAIDFCRYYAHEARRLFATPTVLPGPTGERNSLSLRGRGVWVCISPWNFPLAIFVGQIAAALAAGNTVVAKPAEQTPLTAAYAHTLLIEAGLPAQVLHLLPAAGDIGAALVAHPLCSGVAFTGSTQVAKHIALSLAQRSGPLIPLIAETGGQNAMIVDSSALPEQVVRDVLSSSLNSAGQRCSALRVLCLQTESADKILTMLQGALATLVIGDPTNLTTDIGPLIEADALEKVRTYQNKMSSTKPPLATLPVSTTLQGHYAAPSIHEISDLSELGEEVFGPVLHVLRWRSDALIPLCEQLAGLGYGLTLGIQSRIQSTIDTIQTHFPVGNTYVNRNMIGAVVGVQPFGGHGFSGTGPKAGGPHYLLRFALECTVSVDTTASGGNAALWAGE